MQPLTGWQRVIAKLLPWFDPDEQTDRIVHSDEIAQESVRSANSIRDAYRKAGNKVDRRSRQR